MSRNPKHYAQRMLNPFPGVINVVELDDADAVTRDGVEWILYLHGDVEEERLDDGTTALFQTPDLKYGTWSAHEGLKRAPVRSVVDFEEVEQRGQALLDAIRRVAPHAPFSLADRYECWLLENPSCRPLALVDSACQPPADTPPAPAWNPGQASRREFVSARLRNRQDPVPEGGDPVDAARLARAVNTAAGEPALVQWFERLADGRGIALAKSGPPSPLAGRTLSAADFPELMLTTEWADEALTMLAEDFLAWQAPWLLQLQHLGDATRGALERAARRRAHLTAALHHLYPAVVDEREIRAALVEARMRGTQREPAETADSSMSTFYIELGAFTVGN
jgi:hypothetical protein